VPDQNSPPCIYVLAGTNGAGKSSIAGAVFLAKGTDYFNPDDAAARIRRAMPHVSEAEANSQAWNQGTRLLQRSIAERLNFAFETTLGGNTIPALLTSALSGGLEVRVWYIGLLNVELHIARVKARVEKGGHPIPGEKISERFDRSRLNLIRLLPRLTELLVYDNTSEADPDVGERPEPKFLLHMVSGKIVGSCDLQLIPDWAKPIFAAALRATGALAPGVKAPGTGQRREK
jgi:predicted ABC-type ATPase